jgi:hypothetical protein
MLQNIKISSYLNFKFIDLLLKILLNFYNMKFSNYPIYKINLNAEY